MTPEEAQWWPEGHDDYDWNTAWQEAHWFVTAKVPDERLYNQVYSTMDIDKVTHHHVSYHGITYAPGDPTERGTELELAALIRFKDGMYGCLTAGNDYTGWGCQDYSEMRYGTYSDVLINGMGNDTRELLGLTLNLDDEDR